MSSRRKHHKINTFPPKLVDAVNKMIIKGYTYDDIANFLNDQGFEIHKSSVGRYSRDFLANLERIKIIKEQAKAIVDIRQDSPATEMGEAASMIAMNLVMEALMEANAKGAEGLDKKIIAAMNALAKLEKSGVAREKLKYDFTKGVDAALSKLKESLKAELHANPELLDQVIRLVDQTKEQVTA